MGDPFLPRKFDAKAGYWDAPSTTVRIATTTSASPPVAVPSRTSTPRYFRGSRGQARVTGSVVSKLKATGAAYRRVRDVRNAAELVILLTTICGSDYQEVVDGPC